MINKRVSSLDCIPLYDLSVYFTEFLHSVSRFSGLIGSHWTSMFLRSRFSFCWTHLQESAKERDREKMLGAKETNQTAIRHFAAGTYLT